MISRARSCSAFICSTITSSWALVRSATFDEADSISLAESTSETGGAEAADGDRRRWPGVSGGSCRRCTSGRRSRLLLAPPRPRGRVSSKLTWGPRRVRSTEGLPPAAPRAPPGRPAGVWAGGSAAGPPAARVLAAFKHFRKAGSWEPVVSSAAQFIAFRRLLAIGSWSGNLAGLDRRQDDAPRPPCPP